MLFIQNDLLQYNNMNEKYSLMISIQMQIYSQLQKRLMVLIKAGDDDLVCASNVFNRSRMLLCDTRLSGGKD